MEAKATAGESRAPKSDEIGAACPIADALRPIRGARAAAVGAAPEPMRVDAVETLATLLDLTGSMTLAVQLEAGAPTEPVLFSASPSSPDLAQWIEDRCAPLAASVARRLEELPSSRSAIWSAERMADEIARRGLAGAKRARGVSALAREATDSYLLAIRGLLERIRGDLRGLRLEIGPRLGVRSPRVQRLEAFDALVGRARAAATGRLIARIPQALAAEFALRLGLALEGLEGDDARAAIAAWYRGDGFVARFHADAGRVVRGVFEHDRIALQELVAAARMLESDAPVEHTTQSDAGRTRH